MKLRWIAGGVLILSMVLVFWFVLGLDMWCGFSLDSRPFYFLFGLMELGIGLLVSRCFENRARWLPLALCLVAFGTLPFIDTSPVKPAMRAVHGIGPGMSESEVLAILDRFFPKGGRFRRPDFGTVENDLLAFSLDPSDGCYNAAIVSI